MKRLLIIAGVLGGLAVLAGAGILLYRVATGPRMYHQENIRSYEALMPLPPAGSVPLEAAAGPPEAAAAVSLVNPVAATPENISRGETYYGYYCRFCHGEEGRGEADAGKGYLPIPAPLDSDRVRAMNDGQLVRAMLLGTGHQPVLARIVPVESCWHIALFVRTLGPAATAP
ncbi:MAG: hypothetical protein M0P70_14330 [Desulfobulbaceae bacterium]|nr:hypothetical protein [Desulfobulbaceae bacterium]